MTEVASLLAAAISKSESIAKDVEELLTLAEQLEQAFNKPKRAGTGIVRVNSILPVRTPGRAAAPLFLLTNCRRARPDSTPKIAYTYLP